MLVEDDWALSQALSTFLMRSLNCEVIGPFQKVDHQAFEALESNAIDAALLDLCLENGDSRCLAVLLARKGIPFVIMSGLPIQDLDIPTEWRYVDKRVLVRRLATGVGFLFEPLDESLGERHQR